MPRRNRHEDVDFEIHVDPSCLSGPTHDDLAMMEHEEAVGVATGEAETGKVETGEVDVASKHSGEPETDMDNESRDTTDAAADEPPHVEEQEVSAADCKSHREPTAEEREASSVETETPEAAEEKTPAVEEKMPTGEENTPAMEHKTPTAEDKTPTTQEETTTAGDELPEHPADPASIVESEAPEPAAEEEHAQDADEEHAQEADSASVLHHQATAESEADADELDSRRQSAVSLASHTTSATQSSDRRTSYRTEALIHAAARDIVDRLGTRERESTASATPAESAPPSARPSCGGGESVADDSLVSKDDDDDDDDNDDDDAAAAPDEAGDSSSHHENDGEDDVFSDNSPRSSMGSMDEAEQTKIEQTLSQRNITQRTRSPRISDIPQSDPDEDFVPTVRGTPRPPFRSPSSIHALQMSSPPASALGTPRSSRRTPLPTVSRLGSPSVSAQYSPKKTPPRFKRATPPLVLLHVTLLPLRWPWGRVLDGAPTGGLSAPAKSLREAWRQLRDRTGDTVSDRGILLPHPQNDYEVLEERLLEALELPLRRRARILECGHYLGPANEMSLPEEADGEDGDYADGARSPRAALDRTHWCRTCRSEIRVDSLGQGRVFRVKVYASNGLMRAGAWEACWKEMERVDVELEPIADADLQEELGHLALEQERALEMQAAMAEELAEEEEEDDDDIEEESYVEQPEAREHEPPSSPPPQVRVDPGSAYDDRRARDEERLREIYGHTPPPAHTEAAPEHPRQSDFAPRETPPSPSVEAFGRREERRQAFKSASLPELVLEAAKLLMQDKKNVMIGLLSILIMMLAVRGGTPQQHDPAAFQTVVRGPAPPPVTASQAPVEGIVATAEAIAATASLESSTAEATTEGGDPCEQCSSSVEAVEVSLSTQDVATSTGTSTSTLRVVETVTETVRETVVATETIAVTTSVEAAPSAEAAVEVDAVEVGLAPEYNDEVEA